MPRPDPDLYEGTAAYYVQGRPPYSAVLGDVLASTLELDGSGRLLDVGCGPGVVALQLAGRFTEVIGVDPNPGMVAEARRLAAERRADNVRFVEGCAEHLIDLVDRPFELVTFGQSFHWTDRATVADIVFELLAPGGAIAIMSHVVPDRPRPAGPGDPPIPHDEIGQLLDKYLGRSLTPREKRPRPSATDAEVLARSRFGPPAEIFAPGRPDVVRDVDGVIAGYYSMSYASPRLFGEHRDEFEAETRTLLEGRSPTGDFWDWPGDTKIIYTQKELESSAIDL